MSTGILTVTVWDVGHGVSIWISTPNGHQHWIDLGKTSDFSPSLHVYKSYGVREIDYLIISHPDQDHIEDLPHFISAFGDPRILLRNKALPDQEMFGEGRRQYQVDFKRLHNAFTESVGYDTSPTNPTYNGRIEYATAFLDFGTPVDGATILGGPLIEGNNTSIVAMLLYEGVLVVCPGDIEPLGWRELWRRRGEMFENLIGRSEVRFLVAPHHGRRSGYCKDMMDAIRPHASLISDVWGDSETHPAFRTDPIGIREASGDINKYYTTKRGGRIRIQAYSGGFSVDQWS